MRMRIRTAKPEALKDEELWDLELSTGLPLYRAFQGLWMAADREGRFEWRPRMLKSEILPYWTGDFVAALEALATAGFIVRYTVAGREYGLVPNLPKHQRFDHREPPSELPAPPVADAEEATVPPEPPPGHAQAAPGHAQESPGHARVEGKGRERKGKGEGTDRARAPDPDDPDSVTSIPDDWVVSEALYAEALLAGVDRPTLDEDVRYWRERKSLGGAFRSVEGFFRTHFQRLAKRRETETFRRTRDNPAQERLQQQADRVRMLREQEAMEGSV